MAPEDWRHKFLKTLAGPHVQEGPIDGAVRNAGAVYALEVQDPNTLASTSLHLPFPSLHSLSRSQTLNTITFSAFTAASSGPRQPVAGISSHCLSLASLMEQKTEACEENKHPFWKQCGRQGSMTRDSILERPQVNART